MEIKIKTSRHSALTFGELCPGAVFRAVPGTVLRLKTDEGGAVDLEDGCLFPRYADEMEVVEVSGYFQET